MVFTQGPTFTIENKIFYFPLASTCGYCYEKVSDPQSDSAVHKQKNSLIKVSCVYHSECVKRMHAKPCSNCSQLIQNGKMFVISDGKIVKDDPSDDIELGIKDKSEHDPLIDNGNKSYTKNCTEYLSWKNICIAFFVSSVVTGATYIGVTS